MKLKVINAFCDKIDHVTVYEPGTILEVKDVERAQDLITRELCKEFKGKTAPTFVLGDQESESEAGETNSPDSLTESEGESENNSENQSENNSENQSENNSENESEEESENGSSETSPNSDNDE